MSQAKVDRYKEDKKNRKEIMAKEKRQHNLRVAAAGLVAVVIIGWASVSAYNGYQNNKPLETIYTDMSAIEDYMTSISE